MCRRWFIISLILALTAGTILSLPTFWAWPVVGQKPSQIARHWLNCTFTAVSALTGTGLSPHDLADDFNPAGQALILGYMQAGGLGVLIAGGVIAWRFRRRCDWGSDDEDASRTGIRRLVAFICVSAILFEAAGAAAIYYSTTAGPDAPTRPLFTAVFHSVSAFCNTGLTLTRDSFVSRGPTHPLCAIFIPLMILGGIGGPVLHELWRRLRGPKARRRPLSKDSQVTLIGTAILITAGAAAIFFTESTIRWQLRNPRQDTPGRLQVAADPQEPITFSANDSSSARQQRMRTMSILPRAAAAVFQSVSARTAGLRVARLDEDSFSPAGRSVLSALMLVGGGLGGTAGGLRIVLAAILLGALRTRHDGESIALRAAGGVAVALILLVGCSMLVLIYRETGGVEVCAFEAISAATNSGLSAGLTRLLSTEGQVTIILTMLLGRIIPLAVLANCLRPPSETLPATATSEDSQEQPARC